MAYPVLTELLARGYRVRLISLCELRRMNTPDTRQLAIPAVRLFPFTFRSLTTSFGSSGIGDNQSVFRNFLRFLLWFFVLRPNLVKAVRIYPAVSIVPNDVAFPFNYICRYLTSRKIPFLLMQEGIRFPLPNERGGKVYGSNGAKVILAWGEKSAAFFRSLGLKAQVSGCPRYDAILKTDFTAELKKIDSELCPGDFNILFASNPIDDQGFCTTEEKLRLFEKFLLFARSRFPGQTKIFLRLHPRENPALFRAVVQKLDFSGFVVEAQPYSLFALFRRTQLTVIFASTIGLEALMFGVNLCVIKIPHHGYVFDYVSSGVAIPLDLDNPSGFEWLSIPENARQDYWQGYLAFAGHAAVRTAELIEEQIYEKP